jgi:hypothetical protein
MESKRYEIIRAGSPAGLKKAVEDFLAQNPDWVPAGGPQEDPNRVSWIQALHREKPAANGDMRLREPKRK